MYLLAQFVAGDMVSKIQVDKIRSDGDVIASVVFPSDSDPDKRRKACKPLSITDAHTSLIDVTENCNQQRIDITPVWDADDVVFATRHITDTAVKRREFASLADAIKKHKPDYNTVVEWESTDRFACLDLDFREVPDEHLLRESIKAMRHNPLYAMRSKSGSAHLFYAGIAEVKASEFAVAGLLELQREYPQCKFEIINRSRIGPLIKLPDPKQVSDLCALVPIMFDRGAPKQDWTEYLASRQMEVGKRYPHTHCPVSADSKAKANDPIQVFSGGIKCHKCAGEGIKFGSKDAGWFPAIALIGGQERTDELLVSARNHVHFDQVKPDIEKFNLPDNGLQPLYGALLKATHGVDDPRNEMVWNPCGLKTLYRKDGFWADENNDVVEVHGESGLLQRMPFCYSIDHMCDIALDKVRYAWAKQPCDLSPYGIKPFRNVTGYQFTRFDASQSRVLLAIPGYLRERPECIPAYREPSKRKSLEHCRESIISLFPGIDISLLELLLVGRGCSEYITGRTPCLAITGPTGSGKTLHGTIAAGITGDLPKRFNNESHDRFFPSLHSNSQQSGYFFADELFKTYNDGDTAILTALLQLTPETSFHLLYIGQVRLNANPFVVVTETTIPLAIRQNEQIGRRFVRAQLGSAWKIDDALSRNQIDPIRLRTCVSKERIEIFNDYLSHLTDMYFLNGKPDFFSVAASLGFPLMRSDDAIEDRHQMIRDLVRLIKSARPSPDSKRFGRGYVTCRHGSQDEIWQAFANLQTDQDKRKGNLECDALNEADIADVCKLSKPCRIIVKQHGRLVGFQLREKV